MAFIRCPSCGKMAFLEDTCAQCTKCGALLEVNSDSPVIRDQTQRFMENGNLKGRWVALVIVVAVAVSVAVGMLLH
jgi:hypothetical protein